MAPECVCCIGKGIWGGLLAAGTKVSIPTTSLRAAADLGSALVMRYKFTLFDWKSVFELLTHAATKPVGYSWLLSN